jgi:hypothetical protein
LYTYSFAYYNSVYSEIQILQCTNSKVKKILREWGEPEMQKEIEEMGLDSTENAKPDLFGLTFVQIDEFYPISPQQANSFYAYVQEYYIKGVRRIIISLGT